MLRPQWKYIRGALIKNKGQAVQLFDDAQGKVGEESTFLMPLFLPRNILLLSFQAYSLFLLESSHTRHNSGSKDVSKGTSKAWSPTIPWSIGPHFCHWSEWHFPSSSHHLLRTRISRPLHCWHLGPNQPLLGRRGAVLCIIGLAVPVLSHYHGARSTPSMPAVTLCLENPQLQMTGRMHC